MDQILFELLAAWPGLLGRPDLELVEDSLVLLDFLPESGRVIDVGSGGGLPGLPLKLARPALDLTLLESNGRKAAFLQQVVASLALSGVLVVRARAEAAGRLPAHREAYDIAVVRALAPMPVLAELCLPFVRVGGRLLAMKAHAEAEVRLALPAIEKLGGRLREVAPAPSAARSSGVVVVVSKERSTPAEYPRRAGLPARRPLAGG
ncbi:MAG: 16S rRNA (guanine(527)-N(7))-methyltransferase RsmG [Chloroflexi bacterium]|nr:MAG: 16S rRNA (guanine(527)-N(7))-methyltransferase RsmG [Chloroflexota bacterium]